MGVALAAAIFGIISFFRLMAAYGRLNAWKKRTILPAAQELPKGAQFKTVWGNVGMILYFVFTLVFIVLALL